MKHHILFLSLLSVLVSCKDDQKKFSPVNKDDFQNHRPYFTKVIVNDDPVDISEKIFIKAGPFVNFEGPKKLEDWLTQRNTPVVMQGLKELPIQNGVKGWRITYQTKDLFGKPTLASGALLIPDNLDFSAKHPLVNVLHATITSHYEAPSRFPKEGLWEAGSGLVVAAPDYLGFGESSHLMHPFLIMKGYQESLGDFIKAIYWLAEKKLGINLEKGLYLKGHSEGGYASLALQKYIQEVDPQGSIFRLKGVASSAGPYSTVMASLSILEKEELSSSVLPPYLILAYRAYYPELQEILSDENCFVRPTINGKPWSHWYSGEYEMEYLSNFVPSQRSELFLPFITTELVHKLTNLPQYFATDKLVEKISENDFLVRVDAFGEKLNATVPTLLIGCQGDKVVPSEFIDYTFGMVFNPSPNLIKEIVPRSQLDFNPETVSVHENCPSIYRSTQWIRQIAAGN